LLSAVHTLVDSKDCLVALVVVCLLAEACLAATNQVVQETVYHQQAVLVEQAVHKVVTLVAHILEDSMAHRETNSTVDSGISDSTVQVVLMLDTSAVYKH
jgi:Na+-translocating ferredoxin:NAD+ oxidoreductase RnfG subunit